jgi:hypothetical protein
MKTVKATIEVEFQLEPGQPDSAPEAAVSGMLGAAYDTLVKKRIGVMVGSIKAGSKHAIVTSP